MTSAAQESAVAKTVSEVARLAGVTVRTLHHYDEIGLVRPSGRTEAGYRLYDTAAIERLQEVLLYRALEFSLDDIARIIDDPAHDRATALRDQHALLSERAEQTDRLLKAVEAAMNAQERGIALTDEELLEVFGQEYADEHEEYDQEAQQRWGDTDAWAESRRRTSAHTKQDWQRIKAEAEAVTLRFAELLRSGVAPDSAEAGAAVEAHRAHIDDNFYDCSPQMHLGLAQMYVADLRFTKTYDDVEPGLAQYIHDAIQAHHPKP